MKTTHDIEKQIGARVRMARLMAGMSQSALAKACGNLTFQQFQKYESGTNRVSVSRLLEIAKATGQPVAFFLPDETTAAIAAAASPFNNMDFDIAAAAGRLPPKARAAFRDLIENMAPAA